MLVYLSVVFTTFLFLTLHISLFCTQAHCLPASSDCMFCADDYPRPSPSAGRLLRLSRNMAFFLLRTISGLRVARLISVFRLSGQCLAYQDSVIIGKDPGPVWETACLFPAFTQHTLSLSRPSSPSSWRIFSGPGDFFPSRNKSGFVEA